MNEPFELWLRGFGITRNEAETLRLRPAFEIFLSRLESARQRGAEDPLVTVTAKSAGGNSRACTRRMLDQLGYEPAERRAIHRLFAGSPSGWPGFLRLYVDGEPPSTRHLRYVRRQLRTLERQRMGRQGQASGRQARTGPKAAWVASAGTPYNSATPATATIDTCGPETRRGVASP